MIPSGDVGLGAVLLDNGRCSFRVWAPDATRIQLHIIEPQERVVPLESTPHGYHHAIVAGVTAGTRYFYRINDEKERPDPASRNQPDGVHGPSAVVDPTFAWTTPHWTGIPLESYIVYELHVGTFTEEGTFDAIIPHLDTLVDLGITAIELMPVAQFPGSRNWGYDGVSLYAAHHSYGGVEGLKRLVDACHHRGLAVVLDVVYNHLGPEGNYLWDYTPRYFTTRYQTPWGEAVNFDGAGSDEVRRFFIENALMWVTDFQIDALRLDAVHAITDFSAYPFLRELGDAISQRAGELGRRIYTIAESDMNDPRHVTPPDIGGYGLDSQWSDDFHHTVHTLLTGETDGYYTDFGSFPQMARVLRQGWVYEGDYSAHRQRRHGGSSRFVKANQLVVCTQNHDQVGNRMLGERLTSLVPFEALKLAAGLLLFSPFIPMLFMGEEHGEPSPFLYFVSHSDPNLVEGVRTGRKEEFAAFAWQGEPPDPQAEETFVRSRINHALRSHGHHRVLFTLYRDLIRLRKNVPALATLSKHHMEVTELESERVVIVRRWCDPTRWHTTPGKQLESVGMNEIVLLFHLKHETVLQQLAFPAGNWNRLFDSTEPKWHPQPSDTPSLLPEQILSNGQVTLTLGAYAFAAFVRIDEGEDA